MTDRPKFRRKRDLLGPARAKDVDVPDHDEVLPPFEGQTPGEAEDFQARGIAGIVLDDEGERVEVPRGRDTADAIRSALANKRKRPPTKTNPQEGSS